MKTKTWVGLAGLAAIVATSACGGGEKTATSSQALAELYPLASCGDVETSIKEVAIAEMNRKLDRSLESALKYLDVDCNAYGSSDAGAAYGSTGSSNGGSTSGGGGSAPAPQDDSSKATSVSGTNNQVAGVDEADFVKNDDKYIYIVKDDTFRIVEAWPAPGMHELSRATIEGTAKKVFVNGDRAVVYSSVPNTTPYDPNAQVRPSYTGGRECTYAYDCQVEGDGTKTTITVFDVSNKAAPSVLRTIHLSGSFISARRIGNAVHTVVSSPGVEFEGLSYYPKNGGYYGCTNSYGSDAGSTRPTEADVRAEYEQLRQDNIAIIRGTSLQPYFPTIDDTAAPNAGAECKGFYRSGMADGATFTSVVSLDLASSTPASATTVVSRPGVTYASEQSLYVAVPHQHLYDDDVWFGGQLATEKEASTVHKFHLGASPNDTSYQGSGVVKGHVLSQFSLDEFNGNLRVATSSGHPPDPETHSTISVLAQQAKGLAQIGILDHIAPTEDIRSVRFDGPKGFVVTFKKTDPLFVFDLSSPTTPALLGELQIPGFSTYMHMMDDTHLLTIGYDADDQGSFAWFAGVRLQIFDVANPANPTLLHAEVIGTRGSSSEALTNHLAFNYFADRHLLALPMTVCEGGSGGSYGTTMTFSGLMVYDVTVQNGFSLRGKVAHPSTSAPAGSYYDDASCSNWWTQASSEVKRSIFMDDVVFSISDSRIKANDLSSLSTDVADLSL